MHATVIEPPSTKQSTENHTDFNMKFVYLISTVAALGGLLFGFDTGVISGAIVFMEPKFNLSPTMLGWVVSCALLGSILGTSFAGVLSDRYGRKNILLLSGLLFSVSAVATAIPKDINTFVFARMLSGVAIGITSMLSPMYIAEVAPAKVRGRLVSLNQLAIVTGFLAVFFSNMWIAGLNDQAWNLEYGWRWMFATAVVPSVLFFGLLLFVPESPRWLAKQGREEAARGILTRIGGAQYAEQQAREFNSPVHEECGSLSQLLQPGLRLALLISMVLAVLQQVTGINAVMYYAPKIFESSGASTDSALWSTVLVGVVNLLFTFVAIWLIDKVGRKLLLLAGALGMAIALGGVGAAFSMNATQGPWVLLMILLFIASFAASMGPVVWVMISEIFPTKIRGRAMSIATMTLWIATWAVAQTFPMMLAQLGGAVTFGFYMVMSIVTIVFVAWLVPETKGKSLEEIEDLWTVKSKPVEFAAA